MKIKPRTKKLHKLIISLDENERKERIKDAKVFSFSDIWSLFYDESGGDEANSIPKFKEFLQEEALAIKVAHYPDDGQRKRAYELVPQKPQKKGKKQTKPQPPRKRQKLSDVAASFFEAEDEYMQKHEAMYEKYIAENDEALNIKDEAERKIRLAEIEKKYDEAIKSRINCDNKYELFEKYEATINFLDRLPQEVLTNLVEFKKQCEAKGNTEAFENGFKDLVSQGEFLSVGKNGEYTRIVNEHRFAIGSDNDVVTHSILNLNGSDLDISLTDDGRIAIINCPENMSKDQVKALADYCYKYGIEVKDFGNLKDAKVLDNNGNELGSCEVEFNKAMAENEKSHNKSEKVNVEPVERNNAVYIGESYFGDFIPEEKITRKKKKVKLLGFIDLYDAETKSGLDMDKAKASTQKFAGMDCAMYIDNRRNSTVLSVYASEDDREEDGKIDKNNKVKHTKKFAVVFHHTTPPKATMYLGPKEKITTDHARVILDTYKAQGYKYYTFPPLTSSSGFGKDGQVAFIKASVKTGMVLYLKGADGKGCNIGPADLKTILDETKAEENFINNPDQKVEYLMRWHEQLEKFAKHNPNNAKELADYIGKFKNQASFTYFEKYYKGVIEDEIAKGIKGNDEEGKEPWDRVDMIASQHALTQIVKNIQDGKLGEKRYNPLDREGNQNLIIEEFHRYMKAERKNIEKEIDYNISLIEKEKKVNNPVDTAIRKVEERYEQEFVVVKDDLKASDVDVTIKRRKAIRGYVPNAKTSESNKLYNNIITPAYKARA